MAFSKHNHASTVILSIALVAVFVAPTLLAEEASSTAAGNAFNDDRSDYHEALPVETDSSEQNKTSEAITAVDRCDDRDRGLAERTNGVVPYEILSLDYFGLFMRYFETVGC